MLRIQESHRALVWLTNSCRHNVGNLLEMHYETSLNCHRLPVTCQYVRILTTIRR